MCFGCCENEVRPIGMATNNMTSTTIVTDSGGSYVHHNPGMTSIITNQPSYQPPPYGGGIGSEMITTSSGFGGGFGGGMESSMTTTSSNVGGGFGGGMESSMTTSSPYGGGIQSEMTTTSSY